MAYTLEQFSTETRAILKSGVPLADALPDVAKRLPALMTDPAFVAANFQADTPPGSRALYRDPELDFIVLAHVQAPGQKSVPHTHGTSWAVYGNVSGYTEMTEWRRTNPETEDRVVLEASDKYRVEPGQSRFYGPGVIHSTYHPEKAWLIRVTGTDLDHHPRYRFRKDRDQIVELV
jgi:predicted metal-dependent enzyme (double-stranded beta helix superfamily)